MLAPLARDDSSFRGTYLIGINPSVRART